MTELFINQDKYIRQNPGCTELNGSTASYFKGARASCKRFLAAQAVQCFGCSIFNSIWRPLFPPIIYSSWHWDRIAHPIPSQSNRRIPFVKISGNPSFSWQKKGIKILWICVDSPRLFLFPIADRLLPRAEGNILTGCSFWKHAGTKQRKTPPFPLFFWSFLKETIIFSCRCLCIFS